MNGIRHFRSWLCVGLSLFVTLFDRSAAANIVGYWKFDEGSGSTVVDSSGKGNTGTLTNGPSWIVNGRVANAADFDGTDDYVNTGTSSTLNLAGNHTLAAWIRIDGTMGSQGVVARWSANTAIGLRVDSTGRLLYHYSNSGGSFQSVLDPGTLRATPGVWNHVAMTLDRSAMEVKFYVNGQLSGTASLSVVPTTVSTGAFNIGGMSYAQWFNGAIDEVMLHDRVLTDAEIKGLAGAPYPTIASVVQPSPAPALPVGMDPFFAPPVNSTAPSSSTPQFAEWMRDANAGDAMTAAGYQLSNNTGNDEGKDTEFATFGQNASNLAVLDAQIQRLDAGKTTFSLDGLLPTKTMYWVWPRNSQGFGRPVAINKTEAWWLGPNAAKAGDSVSLYGRNLSYQGGTTTAWIYIKPAASSGQWATVTSINPYRITFTVPATLVNGTYEVWAHNGHGAQYGWSGPLILTVNSGITWSAVQYNVKNYGAQGDGVTNDTSAVQSAITAAASSAYSTVYFPTGTYMLNATLAVPSNVRFKGDGKTISILKGISGTTSSFLSFPSGRTNIEVRDLTVDGGLSPGGTVSRVILNLAGVTNLRFENVSLVGKGKVGTSGNADWLAFTPGAVTTNASLYFVNCDFTGQLFNINNASQIFVDGCHWYAMNDGNSMEFTGSSEVSVTNTTWQDLDSSQSYGVGLGRFAICRNLAKQYAWHHYYGNNTITDSGIRLTLPDINYGEIFLFEYNQAHITAPVSSATNNSVTFSPADLNTNAVPGLAALVIKGKGMGQFRKVTAVNLTTGVVTVTPDWTVTPDSTSKIALHSALAKSVIYNNGIDGKLTHVTTTTQTPAQEGVMAQGLVDFTFASNTLTQVRTGINPYAYGPSPSYAQVPNYFHLYKDNSIDTTRSAFLDRFNATGTTTPQDDSVGAFAHDFRHNTIQNVEDESMNVFWNSNTTADSKYDAPPIEMIMMQRNTITNTPRGYQRGGGGNTPKLGTVLLLNNSIDRGTKADTLAVKVPVSPNKAAVRGNTYSNFSTIYYVQGTNVSMLEAPYRLRPVYGKAGGAGQKVSLAVWNSGTASLSWTAASDSSWLTVSPTSGTVADENSTAIIDATANPASLTAGTYTGTITLTSSGQTKKATVTFVVSN